MSAPTRSGGVVVVADEPMHAARIEAALRDPGGWRVDVSTPRRARALVAEHPRSIVVLALAGADVRRMLRVMSSWPGSAVIVALCDDPARLWTSASRRLGLRAALPLGATADEIVTAVRAVHAGLFVAHGEALADSTVGAAAAVSGTPLTAREREILEMMADGASNRTIASRLAISRHTVKFHVAAILAKLGARSRTEAVALALRRGLLAV